MILKLCSKRWKELPFGHYLERSLQIVELFFFYFLARFAFVVMITVRMMLVYVVMVVLAVLLQVG